MPVLSAGIQGVEFAVDDAIKRHGTCARGDHGREDQSERLPTGPASMIARCHEASQPGQRAGQRRCGKKRTNEPHLLEDGNHFWWRVNLFFFFSPARGQVVGHTQVIQDAGDHGIDDFDDGFGVHVQTGIGGHDGGRRRGGGVPCF